VSTVIKIKDKHDIGYEFVSNCEKMLRESVLAFESLTQPESIIILLDEFEVNSGNPIIAICRKDKDMGIGGILINEITSIYDKERFVNFLLRSYECNKTFYKNKKTEQYFTPDRLQLPEDIKYALSADYYRTFFTKSQVEQDNSELSERSKPKFTDMVNSANLRTKNKNNGSFKSSPSHTDDGR